MKKIFKLLLITYINMKNFSMNQPIQNNTEKNLKLKEDIVEIFKKYNSNLELDELKYINSEEILKSTLRLLEPNSILEDDYSQDTIQGFWSDSIPEKIFLDTIYQNTHAIISSLNKSPLIYNTNYYEFIFNEIISAPIREKDVESENIILFIDELNKGPLKNNIEEYNIFLNKWILYFSYSISVDPDGIFDDLLDRIGPIISFFNDSPLKDNIEEYKKFVNIFIVENVSIDSCGLYICEKPEFKKNINEYEYMNMLNQILEVIKNKKSNKLPMEDEINKIIRETQLKASNMKMIDETEEKNNKIKFIK